MHLEQQPQFIIVLSFSSLLGRGKVKEMQPSFCLKDETIYPAWACHIVQDCRSQRPPLAPSVFGRSVNFISTRVGRLCPTHYYVSPQIFKPSNDSESCILHTRKGSSIQCYLSIQCYPIRNILYTTKTLI